MVKNLIFDLGGVILDLSVARTITGFAKLSGVDIETVKRLFVSSHGFESFERGEINEQEFREFVRALYNISANDESLDECWNAMLLKIHPAKLELLTSLKHYYRTFLLSNTNTIHLHCINNHILPGMNVVSLEHYFHKTYYSHLMKKRKPEPDIFIQVLEENSLVADETLFLDDNAENIAGARAVGLQTAYVNTSDFILDYFHGHRAT